MRDPQPQHLVREVVNPTMRRPAAPGPRMWLALLVGGLGLLIAAPVSSGEADDREGEEPSERIELARPMRLAVDLEDDERLVGVMIAYDRAGFELRDREREVHRIRWDQLEARRVYLIHRELLGPRDGPAWFDLGVRLRRMDDGEGFSDRALQRVERVDETLADRAQLVREQGLEALESQGDEAEQPPGTVDETAGETAGETADEMAEALDVATQGPESVGPIEREQWGELNERQQRASIARLKAFADEGLERIDVRMERVETRYFLFYTDLPQRETRRWANELDQMYHRLAEMFGFERGENIWRGKCLVFLFQNAEDFHRFEAEVHGHPAQDAAGRCWTFGSGEVHITLYRQRDRFSTAHLLIHEAVHGFVHRYRSPVRIPSWLNEGLADKIADDMVPQNQIVHRRQRIARDVMRRERAFGDFFDAPQIQPWHYGVASSMTDFMIDQNHDGYVAMIDGIKDGLPWRQSLEQHYGQTLEELVRAWGESQHIPELSP